VTSARRSKRRSLRQRHLRHDTFLSYLLNVCLDHLLPVAIYGTFGACCLIRRTISAARRWPFYRHPVLRTTRRIVSLFYTLWCNVLDNCLLRA